MEFFLEEAVSYWNLMIEFGRIYPGRGGGGGANDSGRAGWRGTVLGSVVCLRNQTLGIDKGSAVQIRWGCILKGLKAMFKDFAWRVIRNRKGI